MRRNPDTIKGCSAYQAAGSPARMVCQQLTPHPESDIIDSTGL